MTANAPVSTGGSWLSYEKLSPIAIAYCTVMLAVWIPIAISNSHTIHSTETNKILIGRDVTEMVKEHHYRAKQLSDRIERLNKTRDAKGPKGEMGLPGDKGVKGQKGETGMPGVKGRKGSKGIKGSRGNKGEWGDKGERGVPGPKGNNTGDTGPQGPQGQKGEKGDSPPQPSPPTIFTISQAEKGDANVYQTFCWGTCRDITVRLTYNRGGDADLYTKEGSPPNATMMASSRCDDCVCKSLNSNSPDFCAVTTNGQNSFYTAVYAHKGYSNGKVTFDGPNYNYTLQETDDDSQNSESRELNTNQNK